MKKKLTYAFLICSIMVLVFINTYDSGKYKVAKKIKDTTTQNLTTLKFPNNSATEKQVNDILETFSNKDLILFNGIHLDKITDEYVFSAIYESSELESLFKQYNITDLESFNNFIELTTFEEFSKHASPIDLFKYKTGNCYAYSLLTMYYLDKYEPTVNYEIVLEEISSLHMYLKLYNKDKSKSVICDLTKDKYLSLPK